MKFKEYLNERQGLNQILKKSQIYDIGMISAFRHPTNLKNQYEIDKQNEINKRNSRVLKAKLLKMNYSVTDIEGHYREEGQNFPGKEISFLVADYKYFGTLKEDLRKIGKEFEQESIFFKEKNGPAWLIYCNGEKDICLGDGELKLSSQHDNKIDKRPTSQNLTVSQITDFWSVIRDRAFVFESCGKQKFGFDNSIDCMGWTYLAKEKIL